MATSPSNQRFQHPVGDPNEPQDCGLVEIHDHQLYWERYGDPSDPLILMLHHGLGSIRSWRRQIPAFLQGQWQVLLYDRWGYGRSYRRPSFQDGYLLDDTAEAFLLLDTLGIEDLALLGHSDGGTIALLMASQQPERINAIVVVAAHIYFEPPMAAGLELIAQSISDPRVLTGLKREHGDRALPLVDAWLSHWRSADPASLSMRPLLADVACPTLVIQGELDEHATAQHAIDIAEGVQNGDLWLIPDVKHMPPSEIPDLFNQRVLDYLAKLCA